VIYVFFDRSTEGERIPHLIDFIGDKIR